MKVRRFFFASLFLLLAVLLAQPSMQARKLSLKAIATLTAPLPDLAIQMVFVSGQNVIVRIKNIGEASSAPCALAVILVKGQQANSTAIHAWKVDVSALAAKSGIQRKVNLGGESASGRGIVARIDSGEVVAESSELNNKYSYPVPAQEFVIQADLAAQDVYISDSTNQIIGEVKNIGSVNYSGAREARLICITILSSHQIVDTLKTIVVPTLAPGQSFTIKGTNPGYKGVVKYKLRVEIDGEIPIRVTTQSRRSS